MKPWSAVLGARASLLYVLLPLALGAAVSCTTVASSAVREPSPSATAAPSAVATATPVEAPSPTAEAGTPSPTAGPASPLPSPSASPAAILATPSASAAPAAEASATAELTADGPTLDGKTTAKLHHEILSHTAFVEGRIDTTFVERTFMNG